MRLWALGLLSACGFEAGGGGGVPDAPVDATVDARAFDPASDCPATYNLTFAGQSSRYRLILEGRTFGQHSATCAADLAGSTHLAALDDVAEITEAQVRVTGTVGLDEGCAYVGGVQLRDQPAPTTGWLKITGGPLIAMWDPNEPNDGGDSVENNAENFTFLASGRTAQIDVNPNATFGAICECDGKPIDPAASAAIAANL